ncbi:hypothetical protein GS489_00730 [Rhodococcus hoagii]|nr:hypothetical protein [Prescottella equi]
MRTRNRRLSVSQQALALRALLPHARIRLGTNGFTATVKLQPNPVSRQYTVRIKYRSDGVPEVHVLSPALRLHPDAEELPHIYPGNRLCLHLPGEWQPTMFITHTTIPWTSEWLMYYEIWLVTGRWNGGGHGEPSD